ncbi:hypothetical protein [Halobacillus karajensis]|uniref:hypothetical protein n=1 Tax=Halobacillus karajensis TaxID=195088 RepID=UPI00045C640B|nr:hypothetical protein [Halobacillus karajensis]CDQ21734.1 hypothetical protein BN982_04143 [Halobacillus karajensis]
MRSSIVRLKAEVYDKDKEIKELENQLKAKDERIEELEEDLMHKQAKGYINAKGLKELEHERDYFRDIAEYRSDRIAELVKENQALKGMCNF